MAVGPAPGPRQVTDFVFIGFFNQVFPVYFCRFAFVTIFTRTEFTHHKTNVFLHRGVNYPVDFFNGVYELKSAVIIPKPELQKRLLQVIASSTYSKLHNPHYSVLANPYNSMYQNCTEHTLDVINAAIYQTDDIDVIKADEQAYFDAQTVDINPLKLMLGSMTQADVTTADHKGKIKTASYTTIANYLKKYDLVQEELVITQ